MKEEKARRKIFRKRGLSLMEEGLPLGSFGQQILYGVADRKFRARAKFFFELNKMNAPNNI